MRRALGDFLRGTQEGGPGAPATGAPDHPESAAGAKPTGFTRPTRLGKSARSYQVLQPAALLDLVPERAQIVGLGGLPGIGEDRRALDPHGLDQVGLGDSVFQEDRVFLQNAGGHHPVDGFFGVHHVEERHHPEVFGAIFDQEPYQPVVGAQGERRRDQGNQENVRHLEDVFSHQGEPRRAIDEDMVELLAHRLEKVSQALGRVRPLGQQAVHVPVGEIGGQQFQVGIAGHVQLVADLGFPPQHVLGGALDLRLDAHVVAGPALGVQVPDQAGCPFRSGQIGEVDRKGRLPDAAFEIVYGDDFHKPGNAPLG